MSDNRHVLDLRVERYMADRRVRKSKDALKSALMELLRKKSLHEIQIKQLCELADVNRSTFYSNYASVDEILTDIYRDVVQRISERFIQLAFTDDSSEEELFEAVLQSVNYFKEKDSYFALPVRSVTYPSKSGQ